MKKLLTILTMLCCCMVCLAQSAESKKTAILMVHFGTSEASGRAQSLDAINADVKQAFPQVEVRQAYASNIIRRILDKQGMHYLSPLEALMQLRVDGYEKVYVQSTTLMEGIEMKNIRDVVASMQPFFDELKAGNPLLYAVDDCSRVLDILTSDPLETKQEAVLVGHGTSHPSTATYAMLQMMLEQKGKTAWHISTIEGFPSQEMTFKRLQQNKARKVVLIPFLLTAGDHAKNDIANDWKEELEQQGYQVSVKLQGIGEVKAIRDIYIEHIRAMME